MVVLRPTYHILYPYMVLGRQSVHWCRLVRYERRLIPSFKIGANSILSNIAALNILWYTSRNQSESLSSNL